MVQPVGPAQQPQPPKKTNQTPSLGGLLKNFFQGIYRFIFRKTDGATFTPHAKPKAPPQLVVDKVVGAVGRKNVEGIDFEIDGLKGKLFLETEPSGIKDHYKQVYIFATETKTVKHRANYSLDPVRPEVVKNDLLLLKKKYDALKTKTQGEVDAIEGLRRDPEVAKEIDEFFSSFESKTRKELDLLILEGRTDQLLGGRLPPKTRKNYFARLKKKQLLEDYQSFINDVVELQSKRPQVIENFEDLKQKLYSVNPKFHRLTEDQVYRMIAMEIASTTAPLNVQPLQEAVERLYGDSEDDRFKGFLSPQNFEPFTLNSNFRIDPIIPRTDELVPVPESFEIYYSDPLTMETRTARIPFPFDKKEMSGNAIHARLESLVDDIFHVRTPWVKEVVIPLYEAVRADFNDAENRPRGSWAKQLPEMRFYREQPYPAAGLKNLFVLEDGRLSLLPTAQDPEVARSVTVEKNTVKEALENIESNSNEPIPIDVDGKAELKISRIKKKLSDETPYQEITMTITKEGKSISHRWNYLDSVTPKRIEREILLAKGEFFRNAYTSTKTPEARTDQLLGGRAPKLLKTRFFSYLASHPEIEKQYEAFLRNPVSDPRDLKAQIPIPEFRVFLQNVASVIAPTNTQNVEHCIEGLFEQTMEHRFLPFLTNMIEGADYSLLNNYRLETEVPDAIECYFSDPETMETRTVRIPLPSKEIEDLKKWHGIVGRKENHPWLKEVVEPPYFHAIKNFHGEWDLPGDRFEAAGQKHLFRHKEGPLSLHPTIADENFTVSREAVEKVMFFEEAETQVNGRATLSATQEEKTSKDGEPYLEVTLVIDKAGNKASHAFVLRHDEIVDPSRIEREILLTKGEYYRRYRND